MKRIPRPGAVARARRLRRDMTDAERRLWRHLRQRQLASARFRRQVPIDRFIADFASHEARLVIEVDGGQHDLEDAAEKERTRIIESHGYRVLRFSNRDVLADTQAVLETIFGAIVTLPLDGGGRKAGVGSSCD